MATYSDNCADAANRLEQMAASATAILTFLKGSVEYEMKYVLRDPTQPLPSTDGLDSSISEIDRLMEDVLPMFRRHVQEEAA